MLIKSMFVIPALLMTMLGICVCQKGCTPKPINAYFELTNTSSNALTSTVTYAKEVASLLPNDTNLIIYVINGTSRYTYGPYQMPVAFKDFEQDLYYLRVTNIEQHVGGVSDNNDDKGKANIDFIFGRTTCESSVDSKRITYVVVTSNLNHCTDLASDDQHIVQMPLTAAYKEQFQAILCNDTYRLCGTDHFLQGQSCSPCQDVCVNLHIDTNLRFCKDVCKYFKHQLSEPASTTSTVSIDTTMAEKTDPKYIFVYVAIVGFVVGVGVVGLSIIICWKILRQYNPAQRIINRFRPSTKFPQQETTGRAVASTCQEEGATLLSSVNRNSDHDSLTEGSIDTDFSASEAALESGGEKKACAIPDTGPDNVALHEIVVQKDVGGTDFNASEAALESGGEKKACAIPDTGPDNVALHEIVVQNDAIAGPDMTDLKHGGRLQRI